MTNISIMWNIFKCMLSNIYFGEKMADDSKNSINDNFGQLAAYLLVNSNKPDLFATAINGEGIYRKAALDIIYQLGDAGAETLPCKAAAESYVRQLLKQEPNTPGEINVFMYALSGRIGADMKERAMDSLLRLITQRRESFLRLQEAMAFDFGFPVEKVIFQLFSDHRFHQYVTNVTCLLSAKIESLPDAAREKGAAGDVDFLLSQNPAVLGNLAAFYCYSTAATPKTLATIEAALRGAFGDDGKAEVVTALCKEAKEEFASKAVPLSTFRSGTLLLRVLKGEYGTEPLCTLLFNMNNDAALCRLVAGNAEIYKKEFLPGSLQMIRGLLNLGEGKAAPMMMESLVRVLESDERKIRSEANDLVEKFVVPSGTLLPLFADAASRAVSERKSESLVSYLCSLKPKLPEDMKKRIIDEPVADFLASLVSQYCSIENPLPDPKPVIESALKGSYGERGQAVAVSSISGEAKTASKRDPLSVRCEMMLLNLLKGEYGTQARDTLFALVNSDGELCGLLVCNEDLYKKEYVNGTLQMISSVMRLGNENMIPILMESLVKLLESDDKKVKSKAQEIVEKQVINASVPALAFADAAAKAVIGRKQEAFMAYLCSLEPKLADEMKRRITEGPVTDRIAAFSALRTGLSQDDIITEGLKAQIRKIFRSGNESGQRHSETIRTIVGSIPKATR